jgi:predicted GTPase
MSYIIDYIKSRTEGRNQNFIAVCCGKTGSGKSYSCLTLASALSDKFNVDNVVFDAEEFMQLMVSGRLRRSDVVIWDEAGVSLGSRDYMSNVNKAISYFLQSFRKMNLVLLFTIPDLHMIDINVRKLMHGLILTHKIDYEKKMCKVKFFHIDYSIRSKKIYYKYPRWLSMVKPQL